MSIFKKLFSKQVNFKYLVKNGATLIDVRTPEEVTATPVKGALNIPLDTIDKNINKIQSMPKPIVLFCRSGMRSAKAATILKNNGIEEVFNGGGYKNFYNEKLAAE